MKKPIDRTLPVIPNGGDIIFTPGKEPWWRRLFRMAPRPFATFGNDGYFVIPTSELITFSSDTVADDDEPDDD